MYGVAWGVGSCPLGCWLSSCASFLLFSFLLLFLFLLSSRLFLLACSRVHVSRARVFFLFHSQSFLPLLPFNFFVGSLLSGSCVCIFVCLCSVRGVFLFLCTHLHRNRRPPGGEHFCSRSTSHKVYPSTNSRSPPSGASMLLTWVLTWVWTWY